MLHLKEIQQPILDEMDRFSDFFSATIQNQNKEVAEIVNYVIGMQGKQMRPLLLLLCASIHTQGITRESHIAATLIEIMHTASLIHDDVVDEAYQRRGRWSVNALWRSKKAVLIGDYLLSRGIKLAVENNLFEVIRIVSDVIEQMSVGELIQAESSESLNTTRDSYFNVIHCKTATLLGACSASGALTAGASVQQIEQMRRFGVLIGTAFQIKDDILDFTTSTATGKPCLNDIKERKITLPLIEAMQQAGKKEARRVLELLGAVDRRPDNIPKILSFVLHHGGIETSVATMTRFKEEALSLLDEYPDSVYKQALIKYPEYVLTRTK